MSPTTFPQPPRPDTLSIATAPIHARWLAERKHSDFPVAGLPNAPLQNRRDE
jgi:hypothetical protein